MKPGYKILIAIFIVAIGFYFYNKNAQEKERISNEVVSILNNIRREDYFAIHNKLDSKLSKNIGIKDIKEYAQLLALKKDFKFILNDYSKDNGLINIEGTIINNNKELPLKLTLKEDNNTLFILKEQIGNLELKKSSHNLLIGSE